MPQIIVYIPKLYKYILSKSNDLLILKDIQLWNANVEKTKIS